MLAARDQWLLATASAVAATGAVDTSAHAQGAPPIYTWTGYYIGIDLTATRHQAATHDVNGFGLGALPPVPYVTPFFDSSKTAVGVTGHVGYNWQFSRIVAGVEADIGYVGASTTFSPENTLIFCGTLCSVSATNQLDWLATFRGRAGYLITDNVLLYGTGGLALGKVDNRWGFGDAAFGTGPGGFRDDYFHVSEVRAGFVYGGGVEFQAWRNILLRVEVLHADLGTSSSTFVGAPNFGPFGTYVTDFHNKLTTVRGGLSWKW